MSTQTSKEDNRQLLSERLSSINLKSLLSALSLFSFVVIISTSIVNVKSLVDQSMVLGSMVADNLSPTLLFKDEVVAIETLQNLKHSPTVVMAAVFDVDGVLFASYAVDHHKPHKIENSNLSLMSIDKITINKPIIHNGASLGNLLLEIELYSLYQLVLFEMLVVLVIFLLSFYLGKYLLTLLSGSILEPLSELTDFMSNVSKKTDYTMRFQEGEIHELNVLSTGLNNMLEKIQIRDLSLEDYSNNLEKEVELRTHELESAKNLAEQANHAKSDFLSSMSHELRTPLNAILGFSQMLDLDSEELSDLQNQNVQEIFNAGRHLLVLINEVLDLAKIESGKFEVSIEETHLDELLFQCFSLVKPSIEASGLTFKDNATGDDYRVYADFTRLKQVIINLLSNAGKYNTKNGSVEVKTVRINDNQLRIKIIDTGRGLSKRDITRLFSPFVRLSNDPTVEGTGIGLVIVKHLMEAMNGSVGVESELGKGSTFWIDVNIFKA